MSASGHQTPSKLIVPFKLKDENDRVEIDINNLLSNSNQNTDQNGNELFNASFNFIEQDSIEQENIQNNSSHNT